MFSDWKTIEICSSLKYSSYTILVSKGFDLQLSYCTCSEGLGEGYDGDVAFASALETFGGGHNDPISVACGGTILLFWHV